MEYGFDTDPTRPHETVIPGRSLSIHPRAHTRDRRAARDRRLCHSNRGVHESAALAHRPHLMVLRNGAAKISARIQSLLTRFSVLLQFLLRRFWRAHRTAETRHTFATDSRRDKEVSRADRRADGAVHRKYFRSRRCG